MRAALLALGAVAACGRVDFDRVGGGLPDALGIEHVTVLAEADTMLQEPDPTATAGDTAETGTGPGYNVPVRFPLGSVAGRTVVAARIRLFVSATTDVTGERVDAFRLVEAWDEDDASWLDRQLGVPWTAPGALAPSHAAPALGALAIPSITLEERNDIVIDPATVQGWIDDPSTNHGVVLIGFPYEAHIHIYALEGLDPTRGPDLVLDLLDVP